MRFSCRLVATTLGLTTAALGLAVPAANAVTGPPVAVIVRGGSSGAAAAAVARAGGHAGLALDLVSGVAADVPAGAVAVLAREGFSVAPDAPAHVGSNGFA